MKANFSMLSTTRSPAGRSYSGVHRGAGKLFYFGGGHGGYSGNDVELYDLASNTWEQQYQPEDWVARMVSLVTSALAVATLAWKTLPPDCVVVPSPLPAPMSFVMQGSKDLPLMWVWDSVTLRAARCPPQAWALSKIGGGSTSGVMSPLGRPYVLHTYQMVCWDPWRKVFLLQLQAYGTLAFEPTTRVWTPLAGPYVPANPKSPQGLDVMSWGFLQPGIGLPALIVTAGDDKGVWRLGPDNKWKLAGACPSDQWDTPYSCYVDTWKAHLVYCWKRWWRLDALSIIWTPIDGPGPLVVDSFDYDSDQDLVVGIDHGKEGGGDRGNVAVWVMDCKTGAWSQVEVKE